MRRAIGRLAPAAVLFVLSPLLPPAPVALAAVPPTNDDIANATVISSLPFTSTIDTREATPAALPTEPGCASRRNVWYTITPSEELLVTAHTIGSDYDTTILWAHGSPADLQGIFCAQDEFFTQSVVPQAPLNVGTTYFFGVGVGSGGPGGDLVFTVEEISTAANDAFADRTTISGIPFRSISDTASATTGGDDPTDCGNTASVWFSYTATEDASLVATTLGSLQGTTIGVYTGSSPADLTPVACDASFFYDGQARLDFDVTDGTTYHFLVSGGHHPGTTLLFTLMQLLPPHNDEPGTATPMEALPFQDWVDARAASPPPVGTVCENGTNSIWYSYTPEESGWLAVRGFVRDSTEEMAVSAYSGTPGNLTELACNRVVSRFPVTGGATTYIQVALADGIGYGDIRIRALAVPTNDDISRATVIDSLPFTDEPDTSEATDDASDPVCGEVGRSIWYRFTPPVDMRLRFTGGGYVSAYTGTPGALTQVACTHGDVTFDVSGGTSYYLMVAAGFGIAQVTLSRVPTESSLTIAASKGSVNYGKPVTLSGHLTGRGDSANGVVQLFATPYGETKALIASPTVNASGDWSFSVQPAKRTLYDAAWSGDEFHLPSASPQVLVQVTVLLEGKMIRFDGRTGKYRLYEYTSACPRSGRGCPTYSTKLTPPHEGKRLRFKFQVYFGGRWQTIDTFYIRLPASGRIIVILVYGDPGVIGIPARIRSEFDGDPDHRGRKAPWSYFKVVRSVGSLAVTPSTVSEAPAERARLVRVEYGLP